MKDFQYITNAHPSYIENIYNDYVKDPQSVDADLQKFFEGFDFAVGNNLAPNGKTISPVSTSSNVSITNLDKEFAVYQLIQSYRKKGHLIARYKPIKEKKR